MTTNTDVFSKINDSSFSEKIISNIKNGNFHEICHGICNNKDNVIIIDYRYFKHFASKDTYEFILNHITTHINNVVTNYDTFIVHVNIKNLTVVELDKHKNFIHYMSNYMQETYPNKMTKCYIHNPPFVFSQIFNILCTFIDKETIQKIEVIKT